MGTISRKNKIEPLLEEYHEKISSYELLTHKMESVLSDILATERLTIHSISSRTKDEPSLRKKIEKSENRYKNITDITDLSGVRVICLFSDDVDKVGEIVRKNFKVHNELSVDKRQILDPDRFGYLSLHYIVEFPKERITLRDYKPFKGLNCEIQIRSILQHAWAEIEHDFGYKSSIGVPKEIRRKFSLQAGLLELADEQFVIIKKDIKDYTIKVRQQLSQSYKDISIDTISLKDYLQNSDTR